MGVEVSADIGVGVGKGGGGGAADMRVTEPCAGDI